MFRSNFPYRVVKISHTVLGTIDYIPVENCPSRAMAFNHMNYLNRTDPTASYDIQVLVAGEGVREVWVLYSAANESMIAKHNDLEEEG